MNWKALQGIRHTIYRALVFGLVGLSGCVSFHAPFSGAQSDTPGAADHGYALLFELLGNEQNVAKLLIVKRERAELRNLIQEISARAARAHKELEAFAKADQRLNLKDQGLPTAELNTRDSITKARGRQLLKAKGKDFELDLLLTQQEALTYGAHLAAATAAREADPTRKAFLQDLSESLAQLEQKVVAMLLANYSWPDRR